MIKKNWIIIIMNFTVNDYRRLNTFESVEEMSTRPTVDLILFFLMSLMCRVISNPFVFKVLLMNSSQEQRS